MSIMKKSDEAVIIILKANNFNNNLYLNNSIPKEMSKISKC